VSGVAPEGACCPRCARPLARHVVFFENEVDDADVAGEDVHICGRCGCVFRVLDRGPIELTDTELHEWPTDALAALVAVLAFIESRASEAGTS